MKAFFEIQKGMSDIVFAKKNGWVRKMIQDFRDKGASKEEIALQKKRNKR